MLVKIVILFIFEHLFAFLMIYNLLHLTPRRKSVHLFIEMAIGLLRPGILMLWNIGKTCR